MTESMKYYESIRRKYPEAVSKDQFYQIAHISKATALHLLQNGLVPCKDTGKKTRRYTIRTDDIIFYLIDRELHPEVYRAPDRWYQERSGHYNSRVTYRNELTKLSEEERANFRKYMEDEFCQYGDLLTVVEVAEAIGYCDTSLHRWCNAKKLKSFNISGRFLIPKISLVDYHAILPTVQLEKQDVFALPQSEQKILNLVGMRLLCATGEKHTYAETQISLSCEGYEFKTKGKTIVQNGWKAIEELFKSSLKTKEKDDPMKSLPEVHEGDVLDGVSASVTEHFTTPPKQYTEDTLLSAMETAGNDQFDDDTEKKGLGTPATRAGIIEKLVKSGFAERKGKALIPTKDGCNLVCVLPEQIRSPKMTAEWENTLMEIERGNADADAFLSGIVRMTGDLVKAYPFLSDAEAQRFGTGKEEIGKCPRCGSPVYVGKGNFYCSNKECSFCLWEDNKFFSSKKKKLTKKIAKELLDKGWCRVTGLYTPKKPQLYDAVIRLDDSGGKYVSFKMEFDR